MNILILDPQNTVTARYSRFLAIGNEHADWTPILVSPYDLSQDADEWRDSLLDKVHMAEAVICFGDYYVLAQMGESAKLLVDKARAGVPFLLHVVRLLESGIPEIGKEMICNFLANFEVMPSTTKVDLGMRPAEGNWSPFNGYFTKEDCALRTGYT